MDNYFLKMASILLPVFGEEVIIFQFWKIEISEYFGHLFAWQRPNEK